MCGFYWACSFSGTLIVILIFMAHADYNEK